MLRLSEKFEASEYCEQLQSYVFVSFETKIPYKAILLDTKLYFDLIKGIRTCKCPVLQRLLRKRKQKLILELKKGSEKQGSLF